MSDTSTILCKSSSDLPEYQSKSRDLVITDPPFGDNIFYSDLSNFFYAWLRLPLRHQYPELFSPTRTPYAQEALAPRQLSEDEANEYYKIRLTACWLEACRVLKDGGILAFTFHHSEDSQWAIVLDSLFEAGFLLEQTFPIASDEQKGQGGQFGAKGTEYDIIHVCRKRLVQPTPVSWAKMRQWVKAELNRLKLLLAAYKASALSEADIASFSAERRWSSIAGITGRSSHRPTNLSRFGWPLPESINYWTRIPAAPPTTRRRSFSRLHTSTCASLLLFNQEPPPTSARVCSVRLFDRRTSRIAAGFQNATAKWTGCAGGQRFTEFRMRPRREMKTEIDQAHFLIGAAMPNSGVNLEQELSKDSWMVRRSVDAVLEWYGKASFDPAIRSAALLARTILRQTCTNCASNRQKSSDS